MPATSFVHVHRKPLYYARPERTVYDSTDDIRTGWDGSQENEDGKEKESTDDESMGEGPRLVGSVLESPVETLEQQHLGAPEQSWKLLEALAALSSWGTQSTTMSSLELASLVDELVKRVAFRAELRAEHLRRSKTSTTDGLCCPICEGVLRYPVTATCGHTFCRQCCFGHTRCTVCGQRFPSVTTTTLAVASSPYAFTSTPSSSSSTVTSATYGFPATYGAPAVLGPADGTEIVSSSGGFELDILIRRLVERWWGPELKAADLHEEAQRHLEDNSLDEALRCCNQSLEHGRWKMSAHPFITQTTQCWKLEFSQLKWKMNRFVIHYAFLIVGGRDSSTFGVTFRRTQGRRTNPREMVPRLWTILCLIHHVARMHGAPFCKLSKISFYRARARTDCGCEKVSTSCSNRQFRARLVGLI
uniref:RING-type domain-containing protein n=1 Tax=Anopheles culicifacies TaxID=139723 RepID=A0A182LW77_9DIPT